MKHQKVLASVLAVTTLASAQLMPQAAGKIPALGMSISASAATNEYTQNGVTYTLNTSAKTATAKSFNNSVTSVSLPPSISVNGVSYRLTSIDGLAFYGKKLKSISIPSTVTSVGSRAFGNCSVLESVSFASTSNTVTWSSECFIDCKALKTITFPQSLQEIPSKCFKNCTSLTQINLPSKLWKIGANAFENCPLSQTVTLGDAVSNIGEGAFYNCKNLAKFSVSSNNYSLMSDSGVLYSKDHNTLLVYPTAKKDSSYISIAKYVMNGAFSNSYLNNLSLTNLASSATIEKKQHYLPNLSLIRIPAADYKGNAAAIFEKYAGLFYQTKVNKINDVAIVNNTQSATTFNSKFDSAIKANFDQYDDYSFMNNYLQWSAEHVVAQQTNNTMTPLQKMVVLHQWLTDKVTYDPIVAQTDIKVPKSHSEAAAFLNKYAPSYTDKDGIKRTCAEDYYAVCEGYAKTYALLLNTAGIDAYVVGGKNTNPDSDGHAWNIVKLNGTYYHVDVTWDDESYDWSNFMKSNADFKADGHIDFDWSCTADLPHAKYDSALNCKNNFASANLNALGDVNADGVTNTTDLTALNNYVKSGTKCRNFNATNADVNFDGKVTKDDYQVLKLISDYSNWYSCFDSFSNFLVKYYISLM